MKLGVKDFTVIPEDIYTAELLRFEEGKAEFGPIVKLTFGILGGEFDGNTITGLASIPSGGLSPKSKLRAWIEAIIGKKLVVGQEIDLEALLGKRCRINVTEIEKDGLRFNKIDKVIPAPRPRPVIDEDLLAE